MTTLKYVHKHLCMFLGIITGQSLFPPYECGCFKYMLSTGCMIAMSNASCNYIGSIYWKESQVLISISSLIHGTLWGSHVSEKWLKTNVLTITEMLRISWYKKLTVFELVPKLQNDNHLVCGCCMTVCMKAIPYGSSHTLMWTIPFYSSILC